MTGRRTAGESPSEPNRGRSSTRQGKQAARQSNQATDHDNRVTADGSGGLQVLVVGGGVGGLALAGLLSNRGIRPVVIERGDFDTGPSHGLILPDATLDRLAELAIADRARAVGTPLRTWTLRDPDGTVRARRVLSESETPSAVMIRRERLRRHLLETLPSSVVRTETSLARVDQSRRTVEVEFGDGVREHFDVVVGADGVHSRVREWVREDSDGEPLGTTTWAFELDSSLGSSTELTEVWTTDGTAFASLPLDERPMGHLVTHTGDDTDSPVTESLETVATEVDAFPGDGDDTVNARGVWRRTDYRVRPGAWQNGRITLLGDAAHAVHPLSGVGAVSAIEDAYVLADELGGTEGTSRPDGTLSRALTAYVDRRRPHLAREFGAASTPSTTVYPTSPLTDAVGPAVGVRDDRLESYFENAEK